MVRVERSAEASPSDEYTLRFRGNEWKTSRYPVNLVLELRDRFGEVSLDEVVEIRPPHSHEILYLEVRELDNSMWE